MGYIKADMLRLGKSYTWYLGIAGVAFALFCSLEGRGFENGSVIFTYVFATHLSGVLLTYLFSAVPFATVFCEDIEQKYMNYEIIRGNFKTYVRSKCVVIYVSSFLTMVIGTLIFVLLCRTQIPWVNWDMTDLSMEKAGCYGTLLEKGHYVVYCLLYASHLGMWSGLLSLMAALGSVYVSNKLLICVLPILCHLLLGMVNINGYGADMVYANMKIFQYDWLNFGFLFAASLAAACIIGKLIYISLKQRI